VEVWLGADGLVLAHHFPALRKLPGLENPQLPDLDPAGVRARIMAAVYGFFKRQSHRKRIIIAEDLHWADELSLDLLDHLIHNFTGAGAGTGGEGTAGGAGSLLVLANYRPDEAQAPPAFGKWLAAQRGERVRKLTLKPLAPAELEALAQAALGEPRPLGDSARMRLHELTGGNPFFLLELLKNGIEAGGLRRDSAGDWPLSDWLKNSAGSALPDSIDAVLGQRIAALPAALREALPSAAIWGRECAFNDWLALSGLDEVRVSIDSATPETYRLVRGADGFSRIIENVKALRAAKERLGSLTPRISLWMTGLKTNITELPTLIDVAHGAGITEVYLQRLVYSGRGLATSEQALYGRLDDGEHAALEAAQERAAAASSPGRP